MSDNVVANPGSGGATFATRLVTYSGDASTHVAPVGLVAFAGSDDAKTVADIGGDAGNGLDVDVTRLPALVAGTALIGKIAAQVATTATLANVSGATSSTTLLALNANRLAFVIVNDSTSVLYVKFGSTASATSFTYLLQPGQTVDSSGFPLIYTGIITGIWVSATGAARTTEITA
jgi:hypothetical protein